MLRKTLTIFSLIGLLLSAGLRWASYLNIWKAGNRRLVIPFGLAYILTRRITRQHVREEMSSSDAGTHRGKRGRIA